MTPRLLLLPLLAACSGLGCGDRTGLLDSRVECDAPSSNAGGGGAGGAATGGASAAGASSCAADGALCQGAGECCHACVGGVCQTSKPCTPGGAPEVLASDPWYTFDAIEVDGEHVYYTRIDGVARVRKSGGTPELVVAKGSLSFIGTFALDQGHIYSSHSTAAAGLVKTRKSDLSATVLLPSFAADTIRLADGWLYTFEWTGIDDAARIGRVRIDGTGRQVLREGLPNDAEFFQTDGVALYYGRQTMNDVVRDPIDTGAPSVIVNESNAFLGQAGGSVYFRREGLSRVAATGGAVSVLTTSDALAAAFDDTFVYFSHATTPSIRRVPRAGGPEAVLATTGETTFSLAVDESCVYWIEGAQGAAEGVLKRAAK